MDTLKMFSYRFKTRTDSVGTIERKVVVRGMLTLACFL